MAGIIIVGGGQAGGQAAASLRQEKYQGRITLLGEEPQTPYQRPPLSKAYLAGDLAKERTYLRPPGFYADQDIDLRTGIRVTSIDCDRCRLTTDQGDILDYEQLLLATGSRARQLALPGADLAGIHYLRTLADVDGIRPEMAPGRKLVIVGGGYIGLEVAAVAVGAGLEVVVLEMEARILQRVTSQEMSAYYHQLHSSRGVKLRVNTRVSGLVGKGGRVTGVQCGDELLDADLVILGIGILPNVELAESAGIACDNGILVDQRCQTSVPGVYAAGDCTNHPNPLLGRRIRLESVPNAMEQARVAAATLAGKDRTYGSVPWFWSDQYELKLQMLGFSSDGDSQVQRGDMASNHFCIFYLREGRVVAVDAVNSPREFMVCKQLYGVAVDPADLANPEFDLKRALA